MGLWLAATIAHFALTAAWVRAFSGHRLKADELAFHAAVVGLGTLQAVLHGLAFSVGLSFGGGLAALGAVHLTAAAVLARRTRRPSQGLDAADGNRPRTHGPARALTGVGWAVVAALAVQWALAASSSLRVTGADAAHYHVPYAVNLALGANPFGPPATPHLYPMGTSVLAAWFILPFGDPLLVDLANLLPFLLTWCVVLRVVGETTGQSGLAWGPWCAVALFSLPLFRHSLLVSADLFYAASFLAVNALLLGFSVRLRVTRLEAISFGFAIGMLVSTKVTGLFSAATLIGVYGVAIAGRALALRTRVDCAAVSVRIVGGAAAAAAAAGGIWIVRNWWNFGSPLAPSGLELFGLRVFPGDTYAETKYYLSVLGDMRGIDHYDVAARLWHWTGVWLGAWFPLAGLLALAPAAEACIARYLGRPIGEALRSRLTFAAASVALVAVHLAMLAGVPWSSLEWTEGFSLRYALPCAALVWIAAYGSGSAVLARIGRSGTGPAFALAAASLAWYVWHQRVPDGPAEETLACLTLAGAVAGVVLVLGVYAAARLGLGLRSAAAAAVLIAVAATAYDRHARPADTRLVRTADIELDRQVACSDCDGIAVSDYRRAYLGLLGYERTHGLSCARRRVYTTSRWDFPLELQSPRLVNQVFAVHGSPFADRFVERDPPGGTPCDYVIATRAALDTTNGVALVNRLRAQGRLTQAADTGRFVVFAAR